MAIAGGRVYIGAHYPSDVVAGLLFGAGVAVVTYLLTRRVLIRIVQAGARTRLRPLLVDRQHNSTAHGR